MKSLHRIWRAIFQRLSRKPGAPAGMPINKVPCNPDGSYDTRLTGAQSWNIDVADKSFVRGTLDDSKTERTYVKMPALPQASTGNADLDALIKKISDHLEVRRSSGSTPDRLNPFERALPPRGHGTSIEDFAASIRGTPLYLDLLRAVEGSKPPTEVNREQTDQCMHERGQINWSLKSAALTPEFIAKSKGSSAAEIAQRMRDVVGPTQTAWLPRLGYWLRSFPWPRYRPDAARRSRNIAAARS